jgi:uncharacterized protein (TIGR02118 family)
MLKLFAVWTKPNDPDAFERYYEDVHAPIAAAIPGLQKLVLIRTAEALGDEPSPFQRIAELWFEDQAALDAALASEEGQRAVDDAAGMQERFAVQLISPYGTSVDHPLGPYVPKD